MRFALFAGLTAGLLASPVPPVLAQEPETFRLPVMEGVAPAPDCGGLYGLSGRAECVTTPVPRLGEAAQAYIVNLTHGGWVIGGGSANQVLFQRARAGGGCDTLEMISFYDFSLPEAALETAPGYLGFALRMEDACLPPPALEDGALEDGAPQP